MQIEKWADIPNCSGYKISDLGRVIGPRGKIVKCHKGTGNGGYWIFRMPHKKFCKTLHRLVAECFVDNPNNYPEVNHKFGDKDDNRAIVLEWCTRQHNIQHAVRTGLKPSCGNHRLFRDPIVFGLIKECFQQGFTNVSIAKFFNCNQSTIAYIRQGKRKFYEL